MTAQPEVRDGRSWSFDAFVVACAFDEQGAVGFALGDGSLRVIDASGALAETDVHHGASLALTPAPNGGFLSGGDDGRLVHVGTDRPPIELAKAKGKWIEQIAVARDTGLIAYGAGKDATIVDGATRTTFSHGSTVGGLSFDPKGRRLAVAHYDGASLWWAKSSAQEAKRLKWKGSHLG